MEETYILPKAASDVIKQYQELPLGGKKVTTPYFMNKRKLRGGLRVLIGKGTPQEIAMEVKINAQLKNIDLSRMDANQIRQFMQERDIGIDCSGFVVQVLNSWCRSQSGKSLISYLKFTDNSLISRIRRRFRSIENISANELTGPLNCDPVTDLNQLRPGNLIRTKGLLKNSHHVLLVSKVRLKDAIIVEFEYVNSTEQYEEENGIRYGTVKITDPSASLIDQQWLDVKNGRNWAYDGLLKEYEDNGPRVLKRIKLSAQKLN